MAGSYNKVILVGNLTRDPEVKYTPQGKQIASFGLAVNRAYSKKDEVDFFNVTAWEKLAEICGQYLKKGKPVLIEGRIQIRNYEAQDGQKKTSVDVRAENMVMLGSKQDGGSGYSGSAPSSGSMKPAAATDDLGVEAVDVDEFDAEEMPF
jgi:single-strand DNA-binding protein